MKFMRIGAAGAERPAVLDAGGVARDISGIVPDIGPETIEGLAGRLAGVDLAGLPELAVEGARIGAPFARPRNIWCIGLNYSDHAAEAGMPVPSEPIIFSKPGSTLCGPTDPILTSPGMTKIDWEVELGIVIGKPALDIAPGTAMDHVFGYVAANDVSERSWQLERGGQWMKGKSYPNFCPCGPWLVTADEIPDPQALGMELSVNGDVMYRRIPEPVRAAGTWRSDRHGHAAGRRHGQEAAALPAEWRCGRDVDRRIGGASLRGAFARLTLAQQASRRFLRRSERRRHSGSLQIVQAGIGPACRHQIGVAALLDHAAAVKHHDPVGVADGREPVRDHQRRAACG